MEIISQEKIGVDESNTYRIEVFNKQEHSYCDRYQLVIKITNDQYEVKDIYCYNNEQQQFNDVTNLISPEIFQDIIS
jgi:hypothetical protein